MSAAGAACDSAGPVFGGSGSIIAVGNGPDYSIYFIRRPDGRIDVFMIDHGIFADYDAVYLGRYDGHNQGVWRNGTYMPFTEVESHVDDSFFHRDQDFWDGKFKPGVGSATTVLSERTGSNWHLDGKRPLEGENPLDPDFSDRAGTAIGEITGLSDQLMWHYAAAGFGFGDDLLRARRAGAVSRLRGRAPEFFGGRASEAGFLNAAEDYLGPGYREVSRGRYVSADGMRQLRFGTHETAGPRLHGHFEAFDIPYDHGGRIIENTIIDIFPD